MSFATSFIKLPGLSNQVDISDFEDLLELFPTPCLLIDSQSWRIRAANDKATTLTLFSFDELAALDIHQLLPDLQNHTSVSHNKSELIIEQITLIKRDQTQQSIHFHLHPLYSRRKWLIAEITPSETIYLKQVENQRHSQIWQILSAWELAYQANDLQTMLDSILVAVHDLTGASSLAIYHADGKEFILNRLAQFGSANHFPEKLPFEELVHLRTTFLWKKGTPPASTLQQIASNTEISILLSEPIGEGNATTGLLILAGSEDLYPDLQPDHIHTMAQLIGATLEKHFQSQTIQSSLEKTTRQVFTFQKLYERIKEGAIFLTHDQRIINLNSQTELILGYTNQEAHGLHLGKILVSDRNLNSIMKLVEQGTSAGKIDRVRLFHRSGNSFIAEIEIFPINYQGTFLGSLIIIRNKDEEEATKANIKLLEQKAFLGEFHRDFSHEVRNPINNIYFGLQVMERNLPAEHANQDTIARIKQDLDRMAKLMDTILSFSKITHQEMIAINLGDLVQRVLFQFSPKCEQWNIKQHIQIDPDLPEIRGNRHSLEQVFINIIDNAIKVMKDTGGMLAVKIQKTSTEGKEDVIEASITDSGLGIPGEEKPHIFHPFHSTSENGTGLGLVISKKIIDMHKGSIDFESFLGGTIFHVRLPIYKSIP